MPNSRTAILTITLIFLVLEMIITIALIATGNTGVIPNVAGLTAVWIIYTLLELRYGFYMSNYVRIVAMTACLSDSFFGYFLNYYQSSFVFDKIQHAFGTYAFSLFAYVLVAQLLTRPVSRLFTFILVMALGLAIGTVYEISEFIGDLIGNPDHPSQPSLLDTDLDLIGDAIGAVIAGLHVIFQLFKSSFSGNTR